MESNMTLALKLRQKLGEMADSSNFSPINVDVLAKEFNTSNTRVLRATRDLERKTKEIRRHYDANGKLFAARLLPQFFIRYTSPVNEYRTSVGKVQNAMNNNETTDTVANSVHSPFENPNRANVYVRPMIDNVNMNNKSENNFPKTFSPSQMSLRADTSVTNTTYTGAQSTTKAPVDMTISDSLPIISQYAAVLSTTLSLLKEPPQIDPAAQTLMREALRAHEALKLAYSLLPREHRPTVLATLRGI